jgi:hypothetical protein
MGVGRRDDMKAEQVPAKVADNDEVSLTDAAVGSAEYFQAAFVRAATVADRAVGLWLARNSKQSTLHDVPLAELGGTGNDLRALRALARAAATAYVRRLRADGLTPERMLVLVKAATSSHGFPGFGAQELTNDIVRWSIEAYFDE